MPSGVYIRTELARKHIGEASLGRIPWNKGKTGIFSEETLRKISEHNFYKGKKNPQLTQVNKMRQFTPEVRIKMSLRQQGENGSNWKGGITPVNTVIRHSIEMRLWREAVFARDNWTCQKCVSRGVFLHSHHILNYAEYPSLRTAIDNGITLCRSCHYLFHKRYGREHNTREQINEFNTVS